MMMEVNNTTVYVADKNTLQNDTLLDEYTLRIIQSNRSQVNYDFYQILVKFDQNHVTLIIHVYSIPFDTISVKYDRSQI